MPILASDVQRRNLQRRKRLDTLVVLALALSGRLIVLWFTLTRLPKGWLFTRGMEMDLLAKSLLAGAGLSSPFGAGSNFQTGPTAMIAPAYPIFVAGVFRLFGVDSVLSSIVIMLVHTSCSLTTAYLILHLGRRIAREDAALLAAAFWACSLPVIWVPSILWETSFSTCFLISFVALALNLSGKSSHWRWVIQGALCAIAGLFNPALLPSLLALLAWTAYKNSRGTLHKPALAFAAFVLVFSPWPIRNARVFHAFIPTRTTVGFELWMGNRPDATGYLDERFFPTFNAVELADYKQRGELNYFGHKSAIAKAYIRAYSARFVRMTLVRVRRFWSGTGNSNGHVLFAWHALTTTLFGMMGLVMLLRSPQRKYAAFFLIPLALFPLPYYITHAEFRYRLVLDPLMCVLAAHALHRLTRNAIHPTQTISSEQDEDARCVVEEHA